MMRARVSDTCVEIIPPEGYRTDAWHEARRGCVSASEIAAVLGLSTYQSRFDLWWSKKLHDSGRDNRAMSRGRRVEPLVLEDFCETFPGLRLRHVGLVQSTDRPWQVATPDAIAYEAGGTLAFMPDGLTRDFREREPVAVVEAKTDGGTGHDWGEQGSDQIPVAYKAQVLWQMDTVGVTSGFVPVWHGFNYRCYEVAYDLADVEFMRSAAVEFLDSLDRDEPPPVDSHTATTERLKRLHSTVVDEAVVVPKALIGQYLAAQRLRDASTARLRLMENRLRDIIGNAKRATLDDGTPVATRSVYDVKERTQTVGAHTVNRLNVRQASASPTGSSILAMRLVRCAGYTADGERCKREHMTVAETWSCHTHVGQPKRRQPRKKGGAS